MLLQKSEVHQESCIFLCGRGPMSSNMSFAFKGLSQNVPYNWAPLLPAWSLH